jgi:transcriptional regulator with XRE-family HTH domain
MPRPPGSDLLAKRLGARIRRLRERAKLTQERLAWDCDLGKGYPSQVEAGKRLPSLAVLSAIAGRIGVSLRTVIPADE